MTDVDQHRAPSSASARRGDIEAFVAPSSARVVSVRGDDRLSYFESVTSQHFEDVGTGSVRGALYLDQHGSVLAMFDVAVLADRLLLLAPAAEVADTLVDVLGGRTFLADAAFAHEAAVVHSVRGRDFVEVVGAAGIEVAPGTATERDGLVVIGRDDGLDLVGDEQVVETAVAGVVSAGAERAPAETLEAWRVATGTPAWGREVVAGTLPEEMGLLPTHVHLAKGCYPGQEAVARMWMLGRPRRHLVLAAADATVGTGWETGEGRQRTRVTSVATWQGMRWALALVPPGTAVGARMEDDSGAGITVERFVGADLPIPGHDPSVVRRRDR